MRKTTILLCVVIGGQFLVVLLWCTRCPQLPKGLAVNAYVEKPTGLRLPFPPSEVVSNVFRCVRRSTHELQSNAYVIPHSQG